MFHSRNTKDALTEIMCLPPGIKTEYWEESDAEIADDLESPPLPGGSDEDQLDLEQQSLIRWIMLFITLFQTLHVIPERAVGWLLLFFSALLKYLGRFSPSIEAIAVAFPSSVYLMKKYVDKHNTLHSVYKFVVCPKCHSLYPFEETFDKRGSKYVIKTCQHRHLSSRLCGMPLLKRIVSHNGKPQVYPHMIYPYNHIIPTLTNLFRRKDFYTMCESTRALSAEDGISDIFNGRMWKELEAANGTIFLSQQNHYGLFLNVDWYQPYKNRKYSIGVIYLALLNLPREVRYKRENIILVGLIPGPKEPPLTINSYITPLVSELLELWDGVQMPVKEGQSEIVRCALMCVGCDLPAGRKVCGFLSFSANLGCSRCYAEFSEGFGCQNYSGFDRSEWENRTNNKHRQDVGKTLRCTTKTKRERMESNVGCRYSALLQLPYFDPVKMLILDPMHNMYLGTAKYMVNNVWIARGYLNTVELAIIEERLTSIRVPPTVSFGRLPSSIEPTTKLTAEQWMVWVNHFSIFCLHGLLPPEHIECWRHFVLASRLICKCPLSQEDVTVADLLLLQFCNRFQALYGPQLVTPNMHMHCHLADCIRDFGPLSSFWLFPFERYNGILEGTPTNNRSVEVQIMQRFLLDIRNLSLLQCTERDTSSFFTDVVITHAETFQSTATYSGKFRNCLKQAPIVTHSGLQVTPAPKHTVCAFSSCEVLVLKELYSHHYDIVLDSLDSGETELHSAFQKMNCIVVKGQKFNSNSYYLAESVLPFDIPVNHRVAGVTDHHLKTSRPAKVLYFAVHRFLHSGFSTPVVSILAHVLWPQSHPERFAIGKPVEVWCLDLFEATNRNGFIPVENISSQLFTCETKVNGECVLVTIPVM